MKVWKDILSGDEMVSDSYPYEVTFNGACLQVKSKLVTRGGDKILIGDEEDDGMEAQGTTVIDIVDAHRLNEIELDKKGFGAYLKVYLKKVKAKLEEEGKGDRVPEFMKGATELAKFIMQSHDEFQMFAGENFDVEGSLGYCK